MLWAFLNEEYEKVARIHINAGFVPPDTSVKEFAQANRWVRVLCLSLSSISKERGRRALQQSELCRAGPEFARAKRCSLSYTYVISSETRNNKLARKVCQPTVTSRHTGR